MKQTINLLSLVSILFLVTDSSSAQSEIAGTVKMSKPRAAAVPLPRYPNQNIQPGPPEPPVAVVYLDGQFATTSTNAPGVKIMVQKLLQFAPGVLPIQRGTTVEFPNEDDLYHNVFSYSKAKRFDLGRYRKEEKPAAQIFDKSGVVKLNCEIHEHMRGIILVLDTPFFQKTDTNGNYRLENLPAGKFVLKAWRDDKPLLEKPVELSPGQRLRVDFSDN